eukprot:Tbor_TRINITY_DN4878_c0_g3::TRINITY_DN4878_c0_g3_i1::g.1450::m.1450/K02993/RP-S7e, RPS7; small subunit ribosomal protein S7e
MAPTTVPHLRKLRKLKRQESKASPVEDAVAKALFELELNHKGLKKYVKRFHVNTVKEVEHPISKKKALVIMYPLRYLMLVRKIQKALVAELEKKFSGQTVMLIASRKITKRPTDVYKLQKVQRSRTSTAVFENILHDLLHPCEIVGQRIKCRVDGSKVRKIFLNTRERKQIEGRLPLISYVYKMLTHRCISFAFMWNSKLQQVSQR